MGGDEVWSPGMGRGREWYIWVGRKTLALCEVVGMEAVPRSFLGACGQEACFNVWEQRGMKGKWRLAQVLWQSLPSLCPHAVCSRSPIINHEAICLLL